MRSIVVSRVYDLSVGRSAPASLDPCQLIVSRIIYMGLPAWVNDDGGKGLLDDRRSGHFMARPEIGAEENGGFLVTATLRLR
ncbi:MAG: hypothetical protein JWO04_2870 [Gammaproteobacteria bacterium]|nr:hypothetical protein [Gammaproteobacteria bacterium]